MDVSSNSIQSNKYIEILDELIHLISKEPGEPQFHPKANTPSVNGLSGSLLTDNPNMVNPFMIPRSNASTCDNDHHYTRLQEAYNGGLMDKFVQTNSVSKDCNPSITMGYFDGNTVTALWNYAQNFAMRGTGPMYL